MRYEIGEYGLTRGKVACWASETPIHYLWYVEETVENGFDTYEEAVKRIKEKMRSDKETGRQDESLKQGDLIIYFTAGWEEQSIYLKKHIAGTYDKETLDIVYEYDDRIIVEEV
jgi:hypothetical protein